MNWKKCRRRNFTFVLSFISTTKITIKNRKRKVDFLTNQHEKLLPFFRFYHQSCFFIFTKFPSTFYSLFSFFISTSLQCRWRVLAFWIGKIEVCRHIAPYLAKKKQVAEHRRREKVEKNYKKQYCWEEEENSPAQREME